MYNKVKILSGLFLFLLLLTFPVWKSAFISQAAVMPNPIINVEGGHCVESRDFMRAKHMVLLNQWRNDVVRHNSKVYVNSSGEHFKKSLSGTCLKCHSNKEEFCDSCHKAVDVKPYCFDCHISGRNAGIGHEDSKAQSKLLFHIEEDSAKTNKSYIFLRSFMSLRQKFGFFTLLTESNNENR